MPTALHERPDNGGTAFSRCAAVSSQEFAADYWGRAPLLTRGRGPFADLLDPAAVDELVSRRGLRTPFARMARDGAVLTNAAFTGAGGAGASVADQVDADKVLDLLHDGTTLVLQALHRTWPPIVDFTARLSAELGHPVQVNAYVTPPESRGFAFHYDTHDVFVLQTTGTKHWQVFAPVFPDPLVSQPWEHHRDAIAEATAGEPLLDAVLAPGDALYLPRGFVHAADALGEMSIHLTVGVHPVTRYDLARHVMDAAAAAQDLRGSLPPFGAPDSADWLAPHVSAAVDDLRAALDGVDVVDVAARVAAQLDRDTRPEPIAPLATLGAADDLTADVPLRLRTGLRPAVAMEGLTVTIRVPGKTISLPLKAADAVKFISTHSRFAAVDLPGLDAGEQLVVARRLLREGVLVLA